MVSLNFTINRKFNLYRNTKHKNYESSCTQKERRNDGQNGQSLNLLQCSLRSHLAETIIFPVIFQTVINLRIEKDTTNRQKKMNESKHTLFGWRRLSMPTRSCCSSISFCSISCLHIQLLVHQAGINSSVSKKQSKLFLL